MQRTLTKISFLVAFNLLTLFLLLRTNYDVKDMRIYQNLYTNSNISGAEFFYYKYDFLFFKLMSIFEALGFEFIFFHQVYIIVVNFIWSLVICRLHIYVTLRNLSLMLIFLLSIFSSPYIDESFRIYPIILFSGFVLLWSGNFLYNSWEKISQVIKIIILFLLHWSVVFIVIAKKIMESHKWRYNIFITFSIILVVALAVKDPAVTFQNYMSLQSIHAESIPVLNFSAVAKITVILFHLKDAFALRKMLRNIFIWIVLVSTVVCLSFIMYTAVSRLVDLVFHAALVYLLVRDKNFTKVFVVKKAAIGTKFT
jgi:hypothetical protein